MTEPAGEWLIFACRTSYAAEVAEIVWRRNEAVRALVDNLPGPALETDLAPVLTPDELDEFLVDLPVALPLTTPGHRGEAERRARMAGLHLFPPLADPSAIVARTARIGEGTTVNAGAVIGARTSVSRFACVNRSASLGHDGAIGDYATVGPACALGGHVTLGPGAYLGIGVVCAPEVAVGANATVGAGAVVIRDVPAHTVVVGNPAKAIRSDDPGYGGVGVPD